MSARLSRWGVERRLSTLGAREVSIKLTGATVSGLAGFGVVEEVGGKASGSVSASDTVFAKKISKSGLKSGKASVGEGELIKLAGSVPPEVGPLFGQACAADRLLADVVAGDVVLHLGGDTALGQFLAQLADKRGIKLVSFVSHEVPEMEETVDMLKNLGALVAAPLGYVLWPGFRELIDVDLGPASLVVVDQKFFDPAAMNPILDAASVDKFGPIRSAILAAEPEDVKDAKIVRALLAAAKPGAKFLTYSGEAAPLKPLAGSTPFSPEDGLAHKDTVERVATLMADGQLKTFIEAYDASTIDKAYSRIEQGVYRHPFRTMLWLSHIEED